MLSSPIYAAQLVLPLAELEQTFGLDELRQAFVSAYIAGPTAGNGLASYRLACEQIRGKACSNSYAGKMSSLLLREDNEVMRAVELRRRHAALSAKLTEEEYYAGVRVLTRQAMGQERVRKSVVHWTVTDEGDQHEVVDVEVYDPNLSAAKGVLELIGKSLGLLRERTEVSGPNGQPLEVSETGREAYLASLLARHGEEGADGS